MTDARENIGQWPLRGYAPGRYICRCKSCEKHFEGDKRAMQCLPCALTAAGFRILGPDEVDPMTVERAAEAANKRARMAPQVSHEASMALLIALPDAIRALGRKA